MGNPRGDVLADYWLLRSAWHTQGSLGAAALRTCLPLPAHLSGTMMLCRPRFTCGEDPRVGTALTWLAQSNGVCVCVLISLDLARTAHSLRRLLLLVQLTFSMTPSSLDSSEFIVFTCSLAQACLTLCTRLLCPWDSPGQSTGVGCHALLRGIFQTQGSNPHLLHFLQWQAGSLPLTPPGMPHSRHTCLLSNESPVF